VDIGRMKFGHFPLLSFGRFLFGQSMGSPKNI
jgi:hypothetical protein